MKEVLIYGALVATVMAVSSGLIGQFKETVNDQSGQINTNLNEAIADLAKKSEL